jgi:cyclic pyranopterin phosphate synthase
MAYDRFGRWLSYLRISLTDHCNLRCVYCMPEGITFRQRSELMSDEEVLTMVNIFAGLGFDKIRLTGGEPTIRPGVVELVRNIAQIPGVRNLTMTTNGVLFSKLATPLAEAGLQRVNFSLDTLDLDKYRQMTKKDALLEVLEGIHAAESAGLTPIKINVVVMRGFNHEDVIELANLTLHHPWQVRFIEVMPVGSPSEFQISQLVSSEEIRHQLISSLGLLEEINGGKLDGEARLYSLPGALGMIGFISSVTEAFCDHCNRLRLTPDGRLRLCLLREGEVDLLTPLRQGIKPEQLRSLIIEAIWRKPWGNGLAEGLVPFDRVMSEIGG